MKDFLTITEAAKNTGLGQTYIRNGCRSGTIPHIKCGRKYLINYRLFLDQLDAACSVRPDNDTREVV